MSMQMISDEMPSDIVAIRQKKIQFEKWKVITFLKCSVAHYCFLLLQFMYFGCYGNFKFP